MTTVSFDSLDAPQGQGKLEKLFVWAGGYSPRNIANESPERREPIGKLGGNVFFAVFVAAANWTTAGWVFSEGAPLEVRAGIAVMACLIAIMMVLVIDRAMLFFLDTMPQGRRFVRVWIVLRVVIAFAVSAVTGQAAMPLILKGVLDVHALHMREDSEARRVTDLTNRYQLASKDNAVATAKAEAGQLQTEIGLLPPNIQSHLAAVRSCWSAYRARKSALTSAGIYEGFARTILKPIAGQCALKQSIVQKEKEEYDTKMQSLYRDALDRKAAAEADLANATAAVAARVQLAHNIEQEAINSRSPSVMADLLEKDLGVRIMWAFITFALIAMELQPLFTKFLAGKSSIGLRIGTDRAIEEITQKQRIATATHDAAVARDLGQTMQEAILIACRNPETRQFCSTLFRKKIAAFLPFEVVNAVMHQFKSNQIDVDQLARRYPKYATALTQASSQVFREVVDILTARTPFREYSQSEENVHAHTRSAHQQHNKAA